MATRSSDLLRQITVTVSLVVCIVGSMIGVGVFGGTPIAQAAGGALAADSTLLAPATPAFSIWSVVYTGLAAFTVWQWLPSQRSSMRQRSLGWIVAVSMILNAAWILSVQAGWLLLSVLVILALLMTLVLAFLRYSQSPAGSWVEAVVVDGTLACTWLDQRGRVRQHCCCFESLRIWGGLRVASRGLVRRRFGGGRRGGHRLAIKGHGAPRFGGRHRVGGPHVDYGGPQR